MNSVTAIERFDRLFPNSLSYTEKLNMISELDGRIHRELLSRYEGEGEDFFGYSEGLSDSDILLVRYPYDDIYVKYLAAQTDYINGDTVRYGNSFAVFNNLYEEYASYINRTRRLKRSAKIRFGGDGE